MAPSHIARLLLGCQPQSISGKGAELKAAAAHTVIVVATKQQQTTVYHRHGSCASAG